MLSNTVAAVCNRRVIGKMHQRGHIFLLTYMVTVAISVSLAFNVDVTNPDVFTGDRNGFFGFKVLQFKSGTDKGIIVTAPLQQNGSVEMCKVGEEVCSKITGFSLNDTTKTVKNFGLSIAKDPEHSKFTVCSPSVIYECYENSYVNSACYTMQIDSQPSSPIPFQECTKKTVDLVFLFDGSLSMTQKEFNKNKDFTVDIMKSLSNSSIKFAAVQFSTETRTVFDFNDYQAGTALDKLWNEPHMRGLTNTHKALNFVLDELFENPGAGASPDATKVLVLITDGDPSDRDRNEIIKTYGEKHIIRFVIGVKVQTMDKFKTIASERKAFKIEEYEGLTGILENFQKKILKMEGNEMALAENLRNEMAQTGFSAVMYKDSLILGSVGSNSWRGSLYELHNQTQVQIEDVQMEKNSYLGYSISVGQKNGILLYFAGAPRFEHKGQVVVFRHDRKRWIAEQRINADQIGSYFGAELCSVDIDSDGNTDFLLVGAPLFYQSQEKTEGQIYVYKLTEEMKLEYKLNVSAVSMGRFGTSISSLADVNGDGLRDIAVGAPLEDENTGAVYIFLGDRHRGIRSYFSQRIMGKKINPELRYFGLSVDGDIDLGNDGLPDIVVGSKGVAVIMRSRPVFNVTAHLFFQPKEINTDPINCVGNRDEILPMGNLTVCITGVETTKRKADSLRSELIILGMLTVDAMRQTYRGFIGKPDKKERTNTTTYVLSDEETCSNYSIYMPKCVRDTLSPISIKLNFSQETSMTEGAILNVDSKKQAVIEVPFEKVCRNNNTCIAELEVDFNFTTSILLVKEEGYFSMSIKLFNHADDSFNTSLSMHYPLGLSFSKMTLVEVMFCSLRGKSHNVLYVTLLGNKHATRPILFKCDDLEGILDKTVCGVNLPVFRRGSAATFSVFFHIMTDAEWDDTVSVTVTGNSDNMNSTTNNSRNKIIPVQFEIKLAVTVKEDSTTYLNFTTDDNPSKKFVTIYQIDNPGLKAFPVTVSLFLENELENNIEIKNYTLLYEQNKTQCKPNEMFSDDCKPEEGCKKIECEPFILEKESSTEFKLVGDAQIKDPERAKANLTFNQGYTGRSTEVKFNNSIQVNYDKGKYVLNSQKQENTGVFPRKSSEGDLRKNNDPSVKWTEVRVEIIVPPNKFRIICTGGGIGVILLIIITIVMCMLGCFKRKKLEYIKMEQKAAKSSLSNLKTEQHSEEKVLTDEDDSKLPTDKDEEQGQH